MLSIVHYKLHFWRYKASKRVVTFWTLWSIYNLQCYYIHIQCFFFQICVAYKIYKKSITELYLHFVVLNTDLTIKRASRTSFSSSFVLYSFILISQSNFRLFPCCFSSISLRTILYCRQIKTWLRSDIKSALFLMTFVSAEIPVSWITTTSAKSMSLLFHMNTLLPCIVNSVVNATRHLAVLTENHVPKFMIYIHNIKLLSINDISGKCTIYFNFNWQLKVQIF